MKTTLDLPDALMREVKIGAAQVGRKLSGTFHKASASSSKRAWLPRLLG